MKPIRILIVLMLAVLSSCTNRQDNRPNPGRNNNEVESINFKIVKSFPHDTQSFTEGFLFHDNQLFESTGSPVEYPQTRSLFGPVDLTTGKIDSKVELDRKIYFGEGILFLKGKIFQLTYKNQIGFIYDPETYKQTGTFSYSNKEGWGLTTDGSNIIMSDGTDVITFMDPVDMKVVKKLSVTFNGSPAMYINELEYINGLIYANIWTTSNIARIDPISGRVTGIIDLSSLFVSARKEYSNSEATNGIAWDPVKDRIMVTGKFWPEIYQIKFEH